MTVLLTLALLASIVIQSAQCIPLLSNNVDMCPADAIPLPQHTRVKSIQASSYSVHLDAQGFKSFNIHGIQAQVESPEASVQYTCDTIQQQGGVYLESNKLFSFSSKPTACSGSTENQAFAMDAMGIQLSDLNQETVVEFMKMVFQRNNAMNILLKGEADILAKSQVAYPDWNIKQGSLVCDKQAVIHSELSLTGMNGFKKLDFFAPPKVKTGIKGKGILLSVPARIYNPGNVNVKLSVEHIFFDVMFKNEKIGLAILPGSFLDFGIGMNEVIFDVVYNPQTPTQIAVGSEMLGLFAEGKTSDVTVVASSENSHLGLLQDIFTDFQVNAAFIGLPMSLIDGVRFTIPSLWSGKSKASVTLYNPFQAPILIKVVRATMKHSGDVIAKLEKDFGTSFFIDNESMGKSPVMEIAPKLKPSLLSELMSKGYINASVESEIELSIGTYDIKIKYSQNDIEARVGTP